MHTVAAGEGDGHTIWTSHYVLKDMDCLTLTALDPYSVTATLDL
jgi:hypothetical protein